MMQRVCEVVVEYEKRLQEMPYVPRSSYGPPMLREDGGPNRDGRNHAGFATCAMMFPVRVLTWTGESSSNTQRAQGDKFLAVSDLNGYTAGGVRAVKLFKARA